MPDPIAPPVDPPAPPTPPTPGLPPTPPTPPVDPPAPPPPAIGPDGKLGENWFLTLGDEFAPHAKDLEKFKDLRAILTERDYFRKNGVEYPGIGASPQAIERFRTVAGVPEKPEGYGITAEGLPEGMTFDAELAEVVTKTAHAHHTPPAALKAIVGEFNTLVSKRIADATAAAAAAKQKAQDALVADWRGDFQQNASTVRFLTSKLAESAGILPDDPSVPEMANNPVFARMMLQVAKLTSEDRTHTPVGLSDLRSPADRIKMIQNGTDPVWGDKYKNGTTEEKRAAYEYIGQLRAKAAQ